MTLDDVNRGLTGPRSTRALSSFIDSHHNEPAVVIGTSPGMANFPYSKFSGIKICVSDAPIRGRHLFQPDYWLSSNGVWVRSWDFHNARAINTMNPRAMFLGTAMFLLQDLSRLDEMIERTLELVTTPIVFFDDSGLSVNGKLLHDFDNGHSKTSISFENLYEVLAKATNTKPQYRNFASIALKGLALAILFGCRPIFLTGIVLPSRFEDYRYFKSRGWYRDAFRYRSMGPYCEDFSLPNLRQRRLPLGLSLISWELMLLRARVSAYIGKTKLTDFAPHQQQLTDDFRYLASLAAKKTGVPSIFNTEADSLLTNVKSISTIHHSEVMKYL